MRKVTKNDVIVAIANSGVNGVTTHDLAEALTREIIGVGHDI